MIEQEYRIPAILAAALIGAIVSCGNRSEPDDPPAQAAVAKQEGTVTLSAVQPRAALPVTAGLRDANVLTFTVSDVRNPEGRTIRIGASLQDERDTTRTVSIGTVALFPVDQGGAFALRVPAQGRELMAGVPPENVRLVLTMAAEPAPPAGAVEPSIMVGQFEWSRR